MESTDTCGVDKYCGYRSYTAPVNSKNEYRNPKQIRMTKDTNSKPYDLEERTLKFARKVRAFVKKLPKTIANIEDSRQLVKASGSVGANYIEANEAISKKDFIFRIKICRKESKESRYWLRLVDTEKDAELDSEREALVKESTELMKIFGAILQKSN
jgi:four helix bundle protein